MKITHKQLALAALVAMTAAMSPAQADSAPPSPTFGPGMMWGSGRDGYGPGMMGNSGAYGPGMMGGRGFADMGSGMMGGWGRHFGDMGLGMMGMFDPGWQGLDLSDQQRDKLDQIQDETRKKNWTTMGHLLDEQAHLRDLLKADKADPTAVGKVYMKIADLQRQMLETGVEARNRMEALLTKEQKSKREKYRRSW